MASQPSLEKVLSEFFEQGITIGLLGLGTEASLGQMFLTRFVRDHMLYLPVKNILVNNRDTSERMRKVQNIIDANLRTDVTANIRDQKKQQQLLDLFDNGRIKAAESRVIADQADLIILSVDYGFKEPELAPASRYVVFNNNMKIMHQRVSGRDSPRMFELLGDSKAHKLVLTNPVEYMSHFNMRELMKRRLIRDDLRDDFFYFLRDQVDRKEWEIREDLLGIPGKYLVAALKEFDKEYLSFLTKSWSGFVTSDISRQKKIVRDHVRKLFLENEELKDRKFKILYDELYFGEHGAISEPILSS
ncbi:hypothetical protein KY326_02255, partial [Candidatus Woesearchaeota archaeon]|nr:hypothetical protein [Candidatus Woesearchaeota archaeon]